MLLDNKERFLTLCKSIERPGIFDLLDWLEESDFYTAPASTRFHGSYPGGLLEHSLNVYDELKRLLAAYPEIEASEESIAIISLFHDLSRVMPFEEVREAFAEAHDGYIPSDALFFLNPDIDKSKLERLLSKYLDEEE